MKLGLALGCTLVLLAGAWGTAQAENVGIGVLEAHAVLHVRGLADSDDDVIFQNIDAFDGLADTENVLLVDDEDGYRVKTVPISSLIEDMSYMNEAFDFDADTMSLSITEGGISLMADLSPIVDGIEDTDTTVVSLRLEGTTLVLEDSAGAVHGVALSGLDTTEINSGLDFDTDTYELTVTEGGETLSVSLAALVDDLEDTNTIVVSLDFEPETQELTLIDSDFNQFAADLSSLANAPDTALGSHDQVVTDDRSVDLATNGSSLDFVGTTQTVRVTPQGQVGINAGDAIEHALVIGGDTFLKGQTSLMFEKDNRQHGINNIDGFEGGNTNDLEIAARENLVLSFDTNKTADDAGKVGAIFVHNDIAGGDQLEVARVTGVGLGVGVQQPTQAIEVQGNIAVHSEGSLFFETETGNHGINDFNEGGNNQLEVTSKQDLYLTFDSNNNNATNVGLIIQHNASAEEAIEEVARFTGHGLGVGVTNPSQAIEVVGNIAVQSEGSLFFETETGNHGINDFNEGGNNQLELTSKQDLYLTFDSNNNNATNVGLIIQHNASAEEAIEEVARFTGHGLGVGVTNPSQAIEVVGNIAVQSEGSLFFETETGNHGINDFNIGGNNELELVSKQNLYLTFDSNDNNDTAVGVVFQHNGSAEEGIEEVARLNGHGFGIGAAPDAMLHIEGDPNSNDDIILRNLDEFDGAPDVEEVLMIDPADGSRVKTVPITELIADDFEDTTVKNIAASLSNQNVLTITDEEGDISVDLSSLDNNTDTTDLDWAKADTADGLASDIDDSIYTLGNVGINTDEPGYPLVVSTASTDNALVVREANENGQISSRVGIGTDTPGYSLDVDGDIRATGSIYAGDQFLTSNFFQTSDERLKNSVMPYSGGLDLVRALDTVSFRYTGEGLPTNTERVHYGVMAQQVQELDPNLVATFYTHDSPGGILAVNVQSMTYVLANALQQMDAENRALREEVEELRSLKEDVAVLKAMLGLH